MAAEENHTAAACPVFNVGDLDLDDEDSEEEEDDVEDEEPLILTPNPHPPAPPPPPPQKDYVFDVDDDEEEEEEEEEDVTSASAALDGRQVTTAVTGQTPPTAAASATVPDLKRHRIDDQAATAVEAAVVAVEEKKPSAALDDSRRLFQRLWTDEDEIELLQGFLEYTAQRGSSQHHHHDTALFYDQIRGKLQLDFNKNQLVEKLRRLKKKYRNVVNRISSGKDFSFKSPHDQATFEISRKIWSNAAAFGRSAAIPEETTNAAFDDDDANTNPYATPNTNYHGNDGIGMGGIDVNVPSSEKKGSTSRSRKRSRGKSPEKHNSALPLPPPPPAAVNSVNAHLGRSSSIPTLVEETVRGCLSPLFKELLNNAVGGPGIRGYGGMAALNPMPLSFGGPSMLNFPGGDVADERWRKQQILELEVYAKRLELVQDQVKSALEDLRSMGS